MLAWDTKRKLQYFSMIVGFILVFVIIPFYFFIYTPPNCFDGVKNGKETGIDCGGDCRLVCPAEALSPILRWDPRIFEVSPGVFSLLSYIENPNVTAEVRLAPYTFKIYDRDGGLIAERKGETFIPRGKTFAVFDGNFSLEEKTPFRAVFEFGPLIWTRVTDPDPDIEVTNKALMNEETLPRVEATIENREQDRIYNIDLTAIIFDGAGNAIASSRTFVEELNRGERANVFFTWPRPFKTTSKVCESPVDVALVMDRSGSMLFGGNNPPQPLTDVKNSAITFVNQLGQNDQGSLISFATSASNPIDSNLSNDFVSLKQAISNIQVFSSGIQNTNIAAGVSMAKEELVSPRSRVNADKIMVVLTDGVATHPQKSGDPLFPETSAISFAKEAKDLGIRIFTIGLGNDLNIEFLKNLASSPEDSFLAPTTRELNRIYTNIATEICQERPAVIEIIPRVYPR